jgi:transposase
MRPQGSVELLTYRRVVAVRRVVDEKEPIGEVAQEVGVHRNTLSLWLKLFREGGEAALIVRTPPGRPAELNPKQVQDIVKQVLKGPKACGFATDLWTLPRLSQLIERRHGVRYDPDHLSRLVRKWGLSWQKPKTQPVERDPEAIDRWVRTQWPRIKKKPAGSRPR